MEWIPVNKKLPKDGQDCIVTSFGLIRLATYASDLFEVDEYDFNQQKGKAGFFDYDNEYGFYELDSVTAWIPLPEPYRK